MASHHQQPHPENLVELWPEPPADYERPRRIVRGPSLAQLEAAARQHPELYATKPADDFRDRIVERELRRQRLIDRIAAVIVIGFTLLVAYLCATRGWSW